MFFKDAYSFGTSIFCKTLISLIIIFFIYQYYIRSSSQYEILNLIIYIDFKICFNEIDNIHNEI